jgi:hypothetical protein
MAVPWFQILDAVIGLTDVARKAATRRSLASGDEPSQIAVAERGQGTIEARLAGVVVAALKEAFDRDHQRQQFEREQMEAEHQRAERLLRLELTRQAGDREIGRLRLLAAVAVATWLGTLLFSTTLISSGAFGRVALGMGWLLLLAALATSLIGQSRVATMMGMMGRLDDPGIDQASPSSGTAGATATWLIVAGMAVIGLAVLLR